MSPVWELYRLQMDERTDLFKKSKPLKIILLLLGYIAIVAVSTVVLWLVFTEFKLIGLSIDNTLFAVLLLITQVLSFAIALGSIFKSMYFSKDNDLLMSLPCSNNQVFVSKIMVLYTFELIANTLYTLPILIMYGVTSGGVSPAFYCCMPLWLIILPLLALVSAAIVSLPVMWVVKKIRKSTPLTIISIVVLVLVLLAAYMLVVTGIASNIDFMGQQGTILIGVNGVIGEIARYTWYFKFMGDGMLFIGSWWWGLLFMFGITLALILLGWGLIKKMYFRLSAEGLESGANDYTRNKGYTPHSAFRSILSTECYNIFRSPANLTNFGLFALLMPFVVFMYDRLLLSLNVNEVGQNMIVAAHLLVVGIFVVMANVMSATAISREGANFYLTKSSPISIKTAARAKIVFNAFVTIAALLVTFVITALFTEFDLWLNVAVTVIAIALTIGHIIMSLLLDLHKPALDWYDSSEIEKISHTPRNAMLIGFAIVIACFAVLFIFAAFGMALDYLPWVIVAGLVAVYMAVNIVVFECRVKKMYNKLEC